VYYLEKANKWGCISGAVIGFAAGLIAWLVTTAKLNNNVINVVTTGGDFEMLAGNIASFIIGGVIATVASFLWPADFDWSITRRINTPKPLKTASSSSDEIQNTTENKDDEKDPDMAVKPASIIAVSIRSTQPDQDDDLDPVALRKAFVFASVSSLTLLLVFIFIIPLPLFFAQTVYTPKGYAAWVAIGIAWVFCSIFGVVIYPVFESRHAIMQITSGIYTDLFTTRSGKFVSEKRVAV